jgi:hypothetical protein
MMRRRIGGTALLALGLAACGGEGGELRDATARRRAELASGDTSAAGSVIDTTQADTSTRLPVFTGGTPVAPPRPDSVKKDSVAAQGLPGFGTTPREIRHPDASATLRGLRAAANAGFDRLVLDFGSDPLPGWRVEYADGPVQQCGSGEPVQLPGAAALRVHLRSTRAHDDAGQPTLRHRDLPLSMPVMQRLVLTCDFEGEVEVVIALGARQPYRVIELQQPSRRLAVDVQQP